MPKQKGDTLVLYQNMSDGHWVRGYCLSPACACSNYRKTHCDNGTCRFYKEEFISIKQKGGSS